VQLWWKNTNIAINTVRGVGRIEAAGQPEPERSRRTQLSFYRADLSIMVRAFVN
jgi:hypothetical protein